MLRDLLSGLADDSLDEKLKAYVRAEVLLIDEIGFDRLEQESSRNASLFFKVVEGRYCKHSTILTTNIDFKMLLALVIFYPICSRHFPLKKPQTRP